MFYIISLLITIAIIIGLYAIMKNQEGVLYYD